MQQLPDRLLGQRQLLAGAPLRVLAGGQRDHVGERDRLPRRLDDRALNDSTVGRASAPRCGLGQHRLGDVAATSC